jgi:hypothetical protein
VSSKSDPAQAASDTSEKEKIVDESSHSGPGSAVSETKLASTEEIVDEIPNLESAATVPEIKMPSTEEIVDKSLYSESASAEPEIMTPSAEEIVDNVLPSGPPPASSASELHTTEEIVKESLPSESDSAPPVSDMPVPEVIVEKVDGAPRHGDDFGPHATTGQKDAHEMRAQDAEPDHVVIRSQANTPVYANTAAEVADSAAILDREPSPTPVSDEEAGRTGERRMSNTPIPQVALTAAEVADIAMIIDGDNEDNVSTGHLTVVALLMSSLDEDQHAPSSLPI